jgi:hypothetical protein
MKNLISGRVNLFPQSPQLGRLTIAQKIESDYLRNITTRTKNVSLGAIESSASWDEGSPRYSLDILTFFIQLQRIWSRRGGPMESEDIRILS